MLMPAQGPLGRRPMGPMHLIPYVVQSGDSVFVIAQKFRTTMEAILGANCIANPDLINVGQILYIPCPAAPPPRPGAMAWGPMMAPPQDDQ